MDISSLARHLQLQPSDGMFEIADLLLERSLGSVSHDLVAGLAGSEAA